jgi:hypothetical protein
MSATFAFYKCYNCNNCFHSEQGLSMHRSRSSVCLSYYIARLTTILSVHHDEFGTKPCALLRQMSGPPASGSGLVKNKADIIDNGVHNFDFDFAHDHDAIQAQECAQIINNTVCEKKNKNGDPLQFNARTSPVFRQQVTLARYNY